MIRIGARSSPLARTQADLVAAALAAYGVESEFVPIRTQGDVDRRELTQIGGTGVFTAAVRDALLDGSIDIGVHSLKDLPTTPTDGLEVIAYPPREDTREVLVGHDPDCLLATDPGRPIVIGTGAPRRAAQLAQLAADRGITVRIEPIRGNVDTRLEHVRSGRYDATVLAAAGLRRLGRIDTESAPRPDRSAGPAHEPEPLTVAGLPAVLLPHQQLLPAPGQGALAVETVTSLDSEIRRVLTRLDDAVTRAEVLAERRFLAVLEAGCTAPVGARAEVRSASLGGRDDRPVRDPGADLTLVAVIGRTMGDDQTQRTANGPEKSAGDHAGPDSLISRGRLITVTGHGSSTDPAQLGGRLADLALSAVDPSEFVPR